MKVRFTPAARDDVDDIYNDIARANRVAALDVEERIREIAESLEHFPGIGAPTEIDDVRRIPLVSYPYTIFYRIVPADHEVHVLRVVHAASIKRLGRLP